MSSIIGGRRRTVVLLVGAAVALAGAGVLVGRLVGDPDVSTSFAEAYSSGGAVAGETGDATATAAAATEGTSGARPTGSGTAASSTPGAARSERTVSVTYTDVDAASATVQIGAYVPELVETGGTCAVELTQGGRSARTQAASVPDAASTSCGDLSVPLAELGSGSWEGFVTYDSSTATGRSDEFVVVVP